MEPSFVLLFVLIFKYFNPVLAENDFSTQATTVNMVSDSSTPVAATSTSVPKQNVSTKTSLLSTTTNKTPTPMGPKKEIEKIEMEPPSKQIRLDGESLKLNITAFENHMQFSVIISTSPGKIGGKSIASSKRLLLALENDHFNVDVISIPFSSDEIGPLISNKIEDWGWNRRSGVLLKDNIQNYKWISSNSERGNNRSSIYVTLQRKWQTCDAQDVHFGLSPMKIWWLLDMNDINGLTTNNKTRLRQPAEKQKATEINGGEITTTTTRSSSMGISDPQNNKGNGNINATAAKEDDVEILRSIQESNFNGPVVFQVEDLLKNVNFFILGCGDSTQYKCNVSDIQKLKLANHSDFLSVAKIALHNANWNKKDKAAKSCDVVIDYANKGNEKKFYALFGFPIKNRANSLITQDEGFVLLMILSLKYFEFSN